jgi:hypothetical protein
MEATMTKAPKGGGKKEPRGGGAGKHPGEDKMVGKRPDKYGKGPEPVKPFTPSPRKGGRGKGGKTEGKGGKH